MKKPQMAAEKFRKDDRVEDTNSDSLLSKLSVVSQGKFSLSNFRSTRTWYYSILGYRIDPFLRELTSDSAKITSRRSPAINRGYLARLLALEVTFERLLLLHDADESVQVLSLGAGFDSMYFRLLNMGLVDKQSMKYYEVDFPHSMSRKATRISRSQILSSFFKDGHPVGSDDCFSYDNFSYCLVGCDMTDIEELELKLRSCRFDFLTPTIILTECSTTYIDASLVINLVKWFTNKFIGGFIFISYEQIRPRDPFGMC